LALDAVVADAGDAPANAARSAAAVVAAAA
jgi:hypothetical protein